MSASVNAGQTRTPATHPIAPLHYDGGDLGLSDSGKPWIYFVDDSGKRFLTHSVEWLLLNIDLFAQGRDQDQPLACAAVHYGLDAYALMGRPAPVSEAPQ